MVVPTGPIVLICILHGIFELITGFVLFPFPVSFLCNAAFKKLLYSVQYQSQGLYFLLGLQLISNDPLVLRLSVLRHICRKSEHIVSVLQQGHQREVDHESVFADFVIEEISTHDDGTDEAVLYCNTVCGEMKDPMEASSAQAFTLTHKSDLYSTVATRSNSFTWMSNSSS